MNVRRALRVATLGCALLGSPVVEAAINASNLGAAYDATKSSINFKIYSSRATRIDLYLYSAATGQQEKVSLPMTLGTGGVWSLNVTSSQLAQLRHHRHGLLRLSRLGS
ncbi:hypothetical protein [Massilia eburnea]|uniref:hypothetical protein n=1 Tax=Massilia eburnea TaxID=1776165 RepID=UPI003D6BFB74